MEYSESFQVRAVEELALLPEGSAVAEMLADYSVMRDQAQACRRDVWNQTSPMDSSPIHSV